MTHDLDAALRTAIAQGLTGLTLWRVGTSTTMWQASSQWRGRGGYSVHVEADPADAILSALDAWLRSTVPAPSVSSAPTAPPPDEQDIFA